MSIMNRVLSGIAALKAAFLGGHASGSVGAVLSGGGQQERYSRVGSIENFRSWAWIAATRNATAMSSATIRLFARTGGDGGAPSKLNVRWAPARSRAIQIKRAAASAESVEILDHPFLDLVKSVNPYSGWVELMHEASLAMDVTGDAFWLIVRGGGLLTGIPQQLWTLNPLRVTVVPGDGDEVVKGYIYNTGARRVALSVDEVVHFRLPNIANPLRGMGPLEASYTAVCTQNELNRFEADMAANRGVQELFLQVKEGRLDARKRRELMYEWMSLMRMRQRMPAPLIGDGSFDIKPISWSPREMLALTQRSWSREEIVNAYGQTTALYTETPNRAALDSAIYAWSRFHLDPSLTRIADRINAKLLPMYDGGDRLFCAFDPLTLEDEQQQASVFAQYVNAHIVTPNEVRQELGYERSDEPDADTLFRRDTFSPFIADGLRGVDGRRRKTAVPFPASWTDYP